MKRIYLFADGRAEGGAKDKDILGGKGANLAEMINIGLPVPPGFTISTEVCQEYYDLGKKLPISLMREVSQAVEFVEKITGKKFGGENPLLFSVRSGAAISMPGMMDTVLNLGLNDVTVHSLALQSQNPRFAYDSYRRFLQMFGSVVLDVDHDHFEHALENLKKSVQVTADQDLTTENLQALVEKYKQIILQNTGSEFPTDPMQQLEKAIGAIFASWNNDRAIYYRRMHQISNLKGTAVNVQSMVFGNLGEDSGTGVAFTRNPATGQKLLFGEYLRNAQGEDVVAGIRTPQIISSIQDPSADNSMEFAWPEMYQDLSKLSQILEDHYEDMQDIEFTIEKGKLFLLQTRRAKRSARAMVKTALDLYREGVIDKKTLIQRIDAHKIPELLHPSIDPNEKPNIVAKGLPASPGVATGTAVFDCETAKKLVAKSEKVILVRVETSPEDIEGMNISEGIITARGGMTSHAAVVARGIGTPCVSGCEYLQIDEKQAVCSFVSPVTGENVVIKQGDLISIDGISGSIILGSVKTTSGSLDADLIELLAIADEFRTMKVRTNVDTPKDAQTALKFGAEGIGLCRTEHMFFAEDRINIMRSMILSDSLEERQVALDKLEEFQRLDFEGIFAVMDGLPVNVRLIDPPLHEFLPHKPADIAIVATEMGKSVEEITRKVEEMAEVNPMLGFRGCRLGIVMPEIIVMQAKALLKAAYNMQNKGVVVKLELMVPLVAYAKELEHQKAIITAQYESLIAENGGQTLDLQIGTMIELPRAALTADEIVDHADYFSFGTNDLTQTTLGLSRDDADRFLKYYLENDFIEHSPFVTLDQDGVGALIEIAAAKGRSKKPDLKMGICGEHGGSPSSIKFCQKIGMSYVSCSPYRLPVARVAAAQAALKDA